MSVYASDGGDPVTKADLDEFGRRLENDMMAKLWRWAVATMGGSIFFAMAGAWAAANWRMQVDQRLTTVERNTAYMDVNGTQLTQRVLRQLDSLKIEMQYLPDRIVTEMELRTR